MATWRLRKATRRYCNAPLPLWLTAGFGTLGSAFGGGYSPALWNDTERPNGPAPVTYTSPSRTYWNDCWPPESATICLARSNSDVVATILVVVSPSRGIVNVASLTPRASRAP